MDTNIQIELDAVFKAISNFEDECSNHQKVTKELIDLFNALEENVSGGNIHQHITRIIDNLNVCSDKLTTTSDEAITYAKDQINTYISTFDGAKKMFERAMAIIGEYNKMWVKIN